MPPKKQAPYDRRAAEEFGVAQYVPKNERKDVRLICVWTEEPKCEKVATNDVTHEENGQTEVLPLCDAHTRWAQVALLGSVSIRRRKPPR